MEQRDRRVLGGRARLVEGLLGDGAAGRGVDDLLQRRNPSAVRTASASSSCCSGGRPADRGSRTGCRDSRRDGRRNRDRRGSAASTPSSAIEPSTKSTAGCSGTLLISADSRLSTMIDPARLRLQQPAHQRAADEPGAADHENRGRRQNRCSLSSACSRRLRGRRWLWMRRTRRASSYQRSMRRDRLGKADLPPRQPRRRQVVRDGSSTTAGTSSAPGGTTGTARPGSMPR